MPANSPEQQRLFGMALAQKRGKMKGASKKVKELAKSTSEKKLKEFASTKHEDIKEGSVLSFNEFINENWDEPGDAYVDPEGELKDLKFTPEEELEIMSHDDLHRISYFLEEAGAEDVLHSIHEGTVAFRFEYSHETFVMMLDLNRDRARLMNLSTKTEIFEGSSHALFDLIAVKGLEFIKYGQ